MGRKNHKLTKDQQQGVQQKQELEQKKQEIETTTTTTTTTKKHKQQDELDKSLEDEKNDNNTKNETLKRVDLTLLKHKKSIRQMEAERKERAAKRMKEKKKLPKPEKFISPEQFVRRYRKQYVQEKRIRNLHSMKDTLKMDPDYPVALIIRIRGIQGATHKIKQKLANLKLTSIRSAVFVKLTQRTLLILKELEPFVTFGCPTFKTITDLVVKRGYTRQPDGSRLALTDNTIIEKALGEHNIVCLEDIIHEISTCGPAFNKVNKFLCPFHLVQQPGGFSKTREQFTKGGDAGNRKKDINQLLAKMI